MTTYDQISPTTLVLEAKIIMQLLQLKAPSAALEASEMHFKNIEAYFKHKEEA